MALTMVSFILVDKIFPFFEEFKNYDEFSDDCKLLE